MKNDIEKGAGRGASTSSGREVQHASFPEGVRYVTVQVSDGRLIFTSPSSPLVPSLDMEARRELGNLLAATSSYRVSSSSGLMVALPVEVQMQDAVKQLDELFGSSAAIGLTKPGHEDAESVSLVDSLLFEEHYGLEGAERDPQGPGNLSPVLVQPWAPRSPVATSASELGKKPSEAALAVQQLAAYGRILTTRRIASQVNEEVNLALRVRHPRKKRFWGDAETEASLKKSLGKGVLGTLNARWFSHFSRAKAGCLDESLVSSANPAGDALSGFEPLSLEESLKQRDSDVVVLGFPQEVLREDYRLQRMFSGNQWDAEDWAFIRAKETLEGERWVFSSPDSSLLRSPDDRATFGDDSLFTENVTKEAAESATLTRLMSAARAYLGSELVIAVESRASAYETNRVLRIALDVGVGVPWGGRCLHVSHQVTIYRKGDIVAFYGGHVEPHGHFHQRDDDDPLNALTIEIRVAHQALVQRTQSYLDERFNNIASASPMPLADAERALYQASELAAAVGMKLEGPPDVGSLPRDGEAGVLLPQLRLVQPTAIEVDAAPRAAERRLGPPDLTDFSMIKLIEATSRLDKPSPSEVEAYLVSFAEAGVEPPSPEKRKAWARAATLAVRAVGCHFRISKDGELDSENASSSTLTATNGGRSFAYRPRKKNTLIGAGTACPRVELVPAPPRRSAKK